MNVLYLLKTLKTNKLSELVAVMEVAPIDFNIAIWDAIKNGEIEVDENKDKVKALKKEIDGTWHNPELADKIIRVMEQYASEQTNITTGRLAGYMKDPVTYKGYPLHEYLMTLEYLVDTGRVLRQEFEVPKIKGRPYHKFVFLCLKENELQSEDWNARAINKWIDDFAKVK